MLSSRPVQLPQLASIKFDRNDGGNLSPTRSTHDEEVKQWPMISFCTYLGSRTRRTNDDLVKAWYYFANGAVVGPVGNDQLLLAAGRGEIDLDTLVYTPKFGLENWKPLGITELANKVSNAINISSKSVRDVADLALDILSHNPGDLGASSTLSRSVLDITCKPQQHENNHEALLSPPPIPQQDKDRGQSGDWQFVETPNPSMREMQTRRWLGISIGIGFLLFMVVIGITSTPPNTPAGPKPPPTQPYPSQPTQWQIAHNYSATMVDLAGKLSQIMGTQAQACGTSAMVIECATASRQAAYAVADIQDRMAALIVPDCLRSVDAQMKLALTKYGLGYLGFAAGLESHNEDMIQIGINTLNNANALTGQMPSMLRAATCEKG